MGRSFVSGVQRGVAGLVGAPRDLADAWEGGVDWLAEQGRNLALQHGYDPASTLSPQERARLEEVTRERGARPAPQERETPFDLPGSQEIMGRIEQVAGPQHQPQTTAGEYARTVGEFTPGIVAPGGVLRNAVTSVAAPALLSEAAGQVTEDTALEPWARFGAALLGHGVSEGTVALLTRGQRTPDQRALRLMARELADAGYSPQEITRTANRLIAQAPTEEIMGELMGPSGQRLMRATAALGRGAGRSTAEDALTRRAVGERGPRGQVRATSIRDRVVNEAARTFEPEAARAPRDYWDALDSLRTSRAGQAQENYAQAYAQDIDQGAVMQYLAPMMREAPDAAKSGARQLDSEVQRLIGQRAQLSMAGNADEAVLARIDQDIANVRDAAGQLRAIAEGQPPNAINTRAIDYFQRGLQQAEQAAGRGSPEAGALGNFRRGFNGIADKIATGLADTRSTYGQSMAIEDFMDMGRRVFQMSDGELDRALRGTNGRGLSVEEFDGFQLGVLDAVENKLGQGDTAFLARLAKNQNWRDLLVRAAGGEAGARRFMNRLAREASMQGTRNYVLKGSQTTPIAEDIAALTDGENELAFLSDNARALIASGGNIKPLITRWIVSAFDRFNRPGLRNPEVQQAMAARLFQPVTRDGTKELRDALIAARTDPNVPEPVRAWLNRVLAVSSAGMERPEAPIPQAQ